MTALPHFLAQSQQYLLMPATAGSPFAGGAPVRRVESLGFAALLLFFGLTALSALLGA